ncbi:Rpp14/Pop5 family protein [Nanoarchaeota archaeon]
MREEERGLFSAQKMKLKPMMPTLKEKKRYIAFEAISENKVMSDDIINQLHGLLGIFDSAEAGISLVDYNNNKGLLRVSVKGLEKTKASLALVTQLSDSKVILRTLGVSGTLKNAKKYIGG